VLSQRARPAPPQVPRGRPGHAAGYRRHRANTVSTPPSRHLSYSFMYSLFYSFIYSFILSFIYSFIPFPPLVTQPSFIRCALVQIWCGVVAVIGCGRRRPAQYLCAPRQGPGYHPPLLHPFAPRRPAQLSHPCLQIFYSGWPHASYACIVL
jgi:hypothetical protein